MISMDLSKEIIQVLVDGGSCRFKDEKWNEGTLVLLGLGGQVGELFFSSAGSKTAAPRTLIRPRWILHRGKDHAALCKVKYILPPGISCSILVHFSKSSPKDSSCVALKLWTPVKTK
jgi:hypothetical protein